MPTHLNKIQVLVTPEQHRIIKEAAKANLRSMGGELAYRAFAASTKRVSAATDSAGRRSTPRKTRRVA